MELTIQDKTYKFVFGWKFLKEINADNKRVQDGMTINMGLLGAVSNLMIGDVEVLIDVLLKANKTESPKLNEQVINALFDENDVDAVFNAVLDGLKESGFTKKATLQVVANMEQADKN